MGTVNLNGMNAGAGDRGSGDGQQSDDRQNFSGDADGARTAAGNALHNVEFLTLG